MATVSSINLPTTTQRVLKGNIQHKPNPGIDPDWLFRKCLDAAPFVPYIWRTKTPIRFPGVPIMATPQRSLTGPLLLLNRLSEIESDLRSLLPTADKALRSHLIETLSFVEKANQAL